MSLLRNTRASASVEFAFVSLFLFGIVMVGLDFAMYQQEKLKLGDAVEQGAIIAFNARASAPNVDTGTIGSYIKTAVDNAPTVTFQCNGSASCGSSSSMCIGAPATANGWPTFTSPILSTNLCASGATPGYYVVIRATRTYNAVVVPDRYLGGSTIQQQAVVRLS